MTDKKNTIGRFEIIDKIGEGPIGSVYKALDPVIRRTVAIKVIKLYALEETSTFAEIFEKIYRVVRTSTALNHPNICIIYDLSEEKKIPYITMEYVEGHDLDWMLQNKHQFKRSEVMNILQQTCDALDFAHKKNVIHQDLKSTNILLTPDLHVKITDFGIAGLDEIAAAQTKKLLSIPYYISPEQALGEKVSPASDLFSLGVIIYQMLSGQLPFPGTSAANVIMMIARDNPSQPKDLEASGIKQSDWDSFFGMALAKSPNQRFRSANEMFSAIQKILPAAETAYYPYKAAAISDDSTGKFEKTYINDTPTVLIDASKMMEEQSAADSDENLSDLAAATIANMEIPQNIESTMSVAPPESEKSDSAFALLEAALPPKPEPPPPPPEDTSATLLIDQAAAFGDSKPPAPPEPEPEAFAPTQMLQMPELPEPKTIMTDDFRPEMAASRTGQTGSHAQRKQPEPPMPEPSFANKPAPSEEMFDEPSPFAPTQMIEMPAPPPTPPPSRVSPPPPPPARPTPPPAPRPTPPPQPVHMQQQAAPESPYALPASPKPAAPPGAKSALKIYIVVAAVITALIAAAGIYFFATSLFKKDEKKQEAKEVTPPPIKLDKPKEEQKPVEIVPQITSGKITVNTEPPGATVLLNDEEKGITPLEVPDLAFGKYILKVKLKGYQDNQQEIEVSEQTAELHIPITLDKAVAQVGTLVVDSQPSGAFIVIQSKVLGVTPKTLSNQRPGNVSITLKKDGYRDFSGSVRVSAGKTANFQGTLEEIPKQVEVKPQPQKPVEPEVTPGMLVELGPGVTAPRATKRVPAKYPEVAKKQRMEGVVAMNVLVSENGQVLDVKVVKSANSILDAAAVDAVRQWVYQPATKKGVKVKVWVPVSMSFQSGK